VDLNLIEQFRVETVIAALGSLLLVIALPTAIAKICSAGFQVFILLGLSPPIGMTLVEVYFS